MFSGILLSGLFALANAAPMPSPQSQPPPTPICPIDYADDDSSQVDGETTTAGIYCVSGTAGCTIGQTESYSVAVTVSVGAELGLDFDGISAALSTEISYTTETGTSATGEAACPPGPWACGLAVTPSMLQIDGSTSFDENPSCIVDDSKPTGDYTVLFPITDSNGLPVIRVEACTCPEQDGADEPGAPELCPNDCNKAAKGNQGSSANATEPAV